MSQGPKPRRVRLSRRAMILLGVIALAVLALVAWQLRPKGAKEPYRTAAIEQGDITKSVSASGSLQALITVDVGSQISGQISKVLVDFNDQVRKGQVMAILDPQTYESRVAQGEADIQAGVAAVRQAQAGLANAQADYDRKKTLVAKGIYSPSVLDLATAAYRNAQAAVTAAQAKVAQSRAALRSSQVDLARTTIVAPIAGVIVDRKIQPGQTVAASLQAPVLFTIAEDLSKLQVKINVDEADVGQVQEGQRVRFTVDAYPEDTFEGVVTQVRKQPTTDQNVVAYTVIAEADNPQGKLLPGMTSNADIIIETHRNVLKVPVAALRWTPGGQASPTAPRAVGMGGAPGFGGGPGGGFGGPVVGGRSGGTGGGGGAGGSAGGQGRGAMLASLPDELSLDASQRKQWMAIEADLRQKTAAAIVAAGGDRTQMRDTLRKARDEAFAKLDPILRPDQKQKLAALRASLAQGRGRGNGSGGTVYVLRDGKPAPVRVQVGASDGTSTEVTGPVKVGDPVIVGGGPRPKANTSTPFGPSGGAGGTSGQTRVRM